MKTKTLLFSLALIACTFFSVNGQTVVLDEEFSSSEWEAEFTRLNPGLDEFLVPINPNAINQNAYTTPETFGGAGAYDNLNKIDLYFDKYILDGAVEVLETGLCSDGLTHVNPTTGTAVAFRFRNGTGIFELPELPTVGTITIHMKNGNSKQDTNLGLEKYDAEYGTWERIHLFLLRKRNDLLNDLGEPLLDEALSFEVNSTTPIKLRLHNTKYDDGLATRFMNMYHLTVTDYAPNALSNTGASAFKQMGRTLIVEQPTKLSIYNVVGSLVLEQEVINTIEIPASIGNGIFMARTNQGVQKLLLKK